MSAETPTKHRQGEAASILVDSRLALVMGGPVPTAGYAVEDHTLFRNGAPYGEVAHLVLRPHGTEVHYRPIWALRIHEDQSDNARFYRCEKCRAQWVVPLDDSLAPSAAECADCAAWLPVRAEVKQ